MLRSTYLWVGVGSALGGIARYWCYGLTARQAGAAFPWGTMLVNVVGSAIIGFFGTITEPGTRIFVPSQARVFVMAGLCGGFTTFSTFSYETLAFARDGQWMKAAANTFMTILLCFSGVWLGFITATAFNGHLKALK